MFYFPWKSIIFRYFPTDNQYFLYLRDIDAAKLHIACFKLLEFCKGAMLVIFVLIPFFTNNFYNFLQTLSITE